MPATSIDDCGVYYEVLGQGVPLVLTPGGRNPLEMARGLAEQLAAELSAISYQLSGARCGLTADG